MSEHDLETPRVEEPDAAAPTPEVSPARDPSPAPTPPAARRTRWVDRSLGALVGAALGAL